MTPLPTGRQKMKTLFDPLTGLKGSELWHLLPLRHEKSRKILD